MHHQPWWQNQSSWGNADGTGFWSKFPVKGERMLATANKLHVSIRVTKHFVQARDIVNQVKFFLTSSLITMQKLIVVSHAVCVHAGGSNFLGHWGPTSPDLVDMAGWPLASHSTCYSTKFGHSTPNLMGTGIDPKKFAALPHHKGWGAGPSYHTKFGCSVKWYERNYIKFDSSHSAFQGHSRSSELTCIDWPSMTLLAIHNKHGLIMYRFWDTRRKLQNFPTPHVFNTQVSGLPLEFCNDGGTETTRMMLPSRSACWHVIIKTLWKIV